MTTEQLMEKVARDIFTYLWKDIPFDTEGFANKDIGVLPLLV